MFFKITGAPIGSPQFWASKEESTACALRRYGVTDSGIKQRHSEMPSGALFYPYWPVRNSEHVWWYETSVSYYFAVVISWTLFLYWLSRYRADINMQTG
ncbi:MAG: hypothetical protein P8X74_09430 [Reinekea sp.]